MLISKINPNVSFNRAITVNSKDREKTSDGFQKNIIDICKVINGKPSKIYSKEDADKIQRFFYGVLGDCSKNNPVILEKSINGDTVLLSGKEAQQVKDLKSKIKRSFSRYNSDKKLTQSSKKALMNKAYTALGNAVEFRKEDGRRGKPESIIEIESMPQSGNKITYTSYKTSFLPAKDGAVDKRSEESFYPYKGSYNYKNTSYEKFEIIV